MFPKPILHFDILYSQFIDPYGQVVQELPDFTHDKEFMKKLYSNMVRTRIFDAKAIALQRTGKLGTYASTLGQEAIGAGIGGAMQPQDVLCPYYREYGAQFWRGVKMSEILLYWGGDERGSCYTNEKVKQDFPICVPISSQTLHAVGIATAMKLRQEARACVTVLGDGATSRGDFYEAINLAGVWNLPVVFVINNNQWAISVPRYKQSHADSLAQKAIAAGIPCLQVDGDDVVAVCNAVKEGVERARISKGPSLIEALTYRISDHTTADDARRYRNQEEVEQHKTKDPIKRLCQFLKDQDIWNEDQEKALEESAIKEVAEAVAEYEGTEKLPPESMFDHLYKVLPAALEMQRQEFKESHHTVKDKSDPE